MNKRNEGLTLDFIGVGAEKAGTTWLYKVLKSHPEIFMPDQKELHYFNCKFVENPSLNNINYDKPFSWYTNFFKNAPVNSKKGEFTPSYLWDECAPKQIKNYFPNIKILIILRNPVNRTFSQYRFYYEKGAITEDFSIALKKHEHLINRSLYYNQIKRYLKFFSLDQIKIVFLDEVKKDSRKVLTEVEDFLNIKRFIPKNIDDKANETGTSGHLKLNRFLAKTRQFFYKNNLGGVLHFTRKIGLSAFFTTFRGNMSSSSTVKSLTDSEKKELRKNFIEDITKLEELLDKDLSLWKN